MLDFSEYALFCTLNFGITFHIIIKQDQTFYITTKKSKVKLSKCTLLCKPIGDKTTHTVIILGDYKQDIHKGQPKKICKKTSIQ